MIAHEDSAKTAGSGGESPSEAESAQHLPETQQLPLIVAFARLGVKCYTLLLVFFMAKISLRKIRISDKKYFAKWWRDKELLKLTSGVLELISDQEVGKYFSKMIGNKKDHNFMILLEAKVIGHLSLRQRARDWFETQIVIGEKEHWGKGIGTKAIRLLLKKGRRLGVRKVYLEVRPNNPRAIKAYEKCGFFGVKINKSDLLRMELKTIS